MRRLVVTVLFTGSMAVGALALSATASAAGGADVTINGLTTEGYLVQLNGTPTAPLNACTVTGVQKDASTGATGLTAYVDVACPDGC